MKTIFCALAFWLIAASAQAATYWVRSTGTMSGCTPSTTAPATDAGYKATIVAGLSCLASGDTLDIAAGTYNERINNGTSNIPSGKGSFDPGVATTIAGAPNGTTIIRPTTQSPSAVLLMSHPSDLSGRLNEWILWQDLVFDGTNVIGGGGNVITMSQSHQRFLRVEVKNHGAGGSDTNIGAAVSVGGKAGSPVIGFEFSAGSVHDNALMPGALCGINAPYGFYDSRTTGTIIEYSSIYRNGCYGIHGYSGDGDHNSAIYRYNTLWDNQLTAFNAGAMQILARAGINHQVYNNVVYHTTGTPPLNAIEVGGSGGLVANNTIYNSPRAGISLHATCSNCVVRNNITVNSNHNAESWPNIDNNGSATIFSNNLCFGTGGTANCQISGQDPLFISATATPPDFHLASGSPAINAGTPNLTIGITIPACTLSILTGCYNGSAPDLGAFETGVTPVGGPPVLTMNRSTVASGEIISLDVNDDDVNERIEDPGDWIGMYTPGSNTEIDWFYMNGTKTAPAAAINDAVLTFTAPATPGSYEFRFYEANSFNRLALLPFTVTAQGIVLKLSSTSIKIGPSVNWKIGVP